MSSPAVVVDVDGTLTLGLGRLVALLPEYYKVIVLTYRTTGREGDLSQYLALLPRVDLVITHDALDRMSPAQWKLRQLLALTDDGVDCQIIFDDDEAVVTLLRRQGFNAICVKSLEARPNRRPIPWR